MSPWMSEKWNLTWNGVIETRGILELLFFLDSFKLKHESKLENYFVEIFFARQKF